LFRIEEELAGAAKSTRVLAELLHRRGVVFKFNTSVERLRAEGARIGGVITDQGALDADAYVVALGSAAARVLRPLGLDLPIYPVKGCSVTIDLDAKVPAPRSSVMDEHYKVMIPRLGTRLRAAGVAELSGDDVSIRPSGPATVLRSLRELFPQAAIACKGGAPTAWAGLRPITPTAPPFPPTPATPTPYPTL